MSLYYTLIPDRIGLIDEPAPDPTDGSQLPAYTTPRSISIQEVCDLWDEHDDIASLIDGRMLLVGVSPRGQTEPGRYDDTGPEVLCDAGWWIESVLSMDQLLGPEATRIRQIVSYQFGVNQESGYADVVADIRLLDEEIDNLVEEATDALNLAELDGDWWAEQVDCTRGYELIALAASDLVAESGEWNMRARQQLLRPWTNTVGWPLTT